MVFLACEKNKSPCFGINVAMKKNRKQKQISSIWWVGGMAPVFSGFVHPWANKLFILESAHAELVWGHDNGLYPIPNVRMHLYKLKSCQLLSPKHTGEYRRRHSLALYYGNNTGSSHTTELDRQDASGPSRTTALGR